MAGNARKAAQSIAMTKDAAKVFLGEHRIKFVLAQFVDIHGVAKTKAVPSEHFEDVILTEGAGFARFCGMGYWPGAA